jgi:hypothetical protein
LHPLQVGTGAEMLTAAGQNDDAHLRIDGEPGESVVQFGNHGLIECIEHRRLVHEHMPDTRLRKGNFNRRHQ